MCKTGTVSSRADSSEPSSEMDEDFEHLNRQQSLSSSVQTARDFGTAIRALLFATAALAVHAVRRRNFRSKSRAKHHSCDAETGLEAGVLCSKLGGTLSQHVADTCSDSNVHPDFKRPRPSDQKAQRTVGHEESVHSSGDEARLDTMSLKPTYTERQSEDEQEAMPSLPHEKFQDNEVPVEEKHQAEEPEQRKPQYRALASTFRKEWTDDSASNLSDPNTLNPDVQETENARPRVPDSFEVHDSNIFNPDSHEAANTSPHVFDRFQVHIKSELRGLAAILD